MISKDDVQKRMLGGKAISPKNTKLNSMANIANRSPVNKFQNKGAITTTTLSSKKQIVKNSTKMTQEPPTVNSPRQTVRTYSGRTETNGSSSRQTGLNYNYAEKNNQGVENTLPERAQYRANVMSSDRPIQMTKKNGAITINLPNGDSYTGEVQNGKYHGQGQYYFKTQNAVYRGEFASGRQHGSGVLSNAVTSEAIYDGLWEYGKKNGLGNYFYGSEEYYNGEWKNDEKEGNGFFSFRGGSYNGQWIRNRAGGRGNLKLADGTQFKGKFQNNQFIEGTVKYPNGDEYYGQMKNNKRNSEESSYINLATKIRYKGGYFNDRKHGKGSIFYQNGDQLTGTFRDGSLTQNQVASYKWRDGTIFQGWFREGRPHKGTVTWPNGQKSEI